MFGPGSSAASLPSTATRAASGSLNLQRRQSGSREKRFKSSNRSSRGSRDRKTGASPEKPQKKPKTNYKEKSDINLDERYIEANKAL